jgi:putative colanic acid biosynthesis acetyltransferase WcaF
MPNQDSHKGPSFSKSNRAARLLWNIVFKIFFRYSPTPLHSWRAFILKLFGAKLGKGVHVYPNVKIWAPWNLELGDESGIANGAIIYSQGKISIGKRCVVSQGAHLVSGTHDYSVAEFPLITKPITIGDYVWIAADAFIHPGIWIGNGCVIGARSVVIKDMPEWMVCSGHPCRPIKQRIMMDKINNLSQ